MQDFEQHIVLAALGISGDKVPRLREAAFDRSRNKLVVRTKTGGDNRALFDSAASRASAEGRPPQDSYTGPFNDGLRALKSFESEAEDAANPGCLVFTFAEPSAVFLPVFAAAAEPLAKGETEAARWAALKASLGADSELTRAIDVCRLALEKLDGGATFHAASITQTPPA